MAAVETELPSVSATPTADAIPLRLRRGGGTARQVLAMTLIGALVLAVFASRDLSSWLERIGDGPVLVPIKHTAAEWDGLMDRLGLTRPHELLRLAIQGLLDWEWPGRQ